MYKESERERERERERECEDIYTTLLVCDQYGVFFLLSASLLIASLHVEGNCSAASQAEQTFPGSCN